MRWSKAITGIVITLMLVGCGITGYERWAAYEVDIRILADGQPISGAQISYKGEQVRTDAQGRATLHYMIRGIKVVTITAPGWMTVQQRLAIPLQQPEVVDIELETPSQGQNPFPSMATNN